MDVREIEHSDQSILPKKLISLRLSNGVAITFSILTPPPNTGNHAKFTLFNPEVLNS